MHIRVFKVFARTACGQRKVLAQWSSRCTLHPERRAELGASLDGWSRSSGPSGPRRLGCTGCYWPPPAPQRGSRLAPCGGRAVGVRRCTCWASECVRGVGASPLRKGLRQGLLFCPDVSDLRGQEKPKTAPHRGSFGCGGLLASERDVDPKDETCRQAAWLGAGSRRIWGQSCLQICLLLRTGVPFPTNTGSLGLAMKLFSQVGIRIHAFIK